MKQWGEIFLQLEILKVLLDRRWMKEEVGSLGV